MATRTNRDPKTEDRNQAAVKERKREIATGENPPGIERGHSPRDAKGKEKADR